ncbi:MAG: protoporphyrinogen oxidase [Acidobacteria bacterium]|nr:protoporphyrinogen oxidase [Acidobacteriota bacterium]
MNGPIVIVGGGIAGLATAMWLEADHGIDDVLVLDAGPQPGGKIGTLVEDGFVLEKGPQGFLDNAPDTLELARLAGLTDRLVRAGDNSAARYIVRKGRPRKVPLKPPAFLFSGLLPLGARLRVLAEPLGRRRPEGDESVYDFARRRIGAAAARILVDAMVTGVYAGDSKALSLAATFPKMAAMEAEHGSLMRALIHRMREARRTGAASGGPSGPSGTLTTFAGGMAELPEAIGRHLRDRLSSGTAVRSIVRRDGVLELTIEGDVIRARSVVLALPAREAAALLRELTPQAVEPLSRIPTAPIAVLMSDHPAPGGTASAARGFGFLVPREEDLGILGCLYCHDIFPGQAPAGRLLFRTMLGGARQPEMAVLDDTELVEHSMGVLRRILHLEAPPERHWIFRWERGIAQYTIGHLKRVETAEEATAGTGIFLTGSSYHGVSVNDCIKNARATATRVAHELPSS